MKERVREFVMVFARLLKPSPGKIAVFCVLGTMLLLLPLYPVHVDTFVGPSEDSLETLEKSGTTMKSLYAVLEGNYNWTETDITMREMGLFVRFWDYHVSYYDANPAYLGMFLALGFFIYCASCYYVEAERAERKTRD